MTARGIRARLVLLLLGLLAWNSLWFRPWVVDDAFISLRYAWNLAHGAGLVYNPGEAVEGYSNLLWVLLGAGALRLGIEPLAALQAVGLLAGLLTALFTLLLARRLFRGEAAPEIGSWLALSLLAVNASLAVYMQAGLETALFACLLVASVWRHELELARAGMWPLSAALFALAWLTRPEAPVFLLYFVGRRLLSRDAPPPGRGDVVRLAVFGAPVAIAEIWGWMTYGALLPNTWVAKTVGGSQIAELLRQPLLARFLTGQGWGWMALLAGGLAGAALGWRRLPRAITLPLAGGLVFVLYARRDWMPLFRLLVPTLPFLVLAIAFGWSEILRRARPRTSLRLAAGLVLLGAFAQYAWVQMRVTHADPSLARTSLRERSVAWPFEVVGRLGTREWASGPGEIAADVLERLPASEWVAARDIGQLGWVTMNPIWDLPGLFTPTAARARRERSEAATAAMLADLRARRPGCIMVQKDRDAGMWSTDRLFDWLQTDPWVAETYLVQRREARGAVFLTAWRRDLRPIEVLPRLREARGRVPGHPEIERRVRAAESVWQPAGGGLD